MNGFKLPITTISSNLRCLTFLKFKCVHKPETEINENKECRHLSSGVRNVISLCDMIKNKVDENNLNGYLTNAEDPIDCDETARETVFKSENGVGQV